MSKIAPVIIILAAATGYCVAQQENNLPVQISQTAPIEGTIGGTCPSDQLLAQARNDTTTVIRSTLTDTVIPILNSRSVTIESLCPCGGAGKWRRIAHLDMSDPNQQCPSNWRLVTTPERACGRSTFNPSCDSAIFSSGGESYTRVCGRVNAYQSGLNNAFTPGLWHNPGLEGRYMDGVSVTHGNPGSRQHIWSFVAALYETSPSYRIQAVCACTNTNFEWTPNNVEDIAFVGNNYFCDTGNPGPTHSPNAVYLDDPLWDGEGCGPTSTCCEFNNPPWFCVTLPQPTTDDIELRNCHDENMNDEDLNIQLVEIYTM